MDVLVPGVGELIGGSVREERLEPLLARMAALGMDPAQYGQYLDLRRYGSVPHGGFGLGFERLIAYLAGLSSVRDAIAYPKTAAG
jgi:asparaginyl-tRNA synthetase